MIFQDLLYVKHILLVNYISYDFMNSSWFYGGTGIIFSLPLKQEREMGRMARAKLNENMLYDIKTPALRLYQWTNTLCQRNPVRFCLWKVLTVGIRSIVATRFSLHYSNIHWFKKSTTLTIVSSIYYKLSHWHKG